MLNALGDEMPLHLAVPTLSRMLCALGHRRRQAQVSAAQLRASCSALKSGLQWDKEARMQLACSPRAGLHLDVCAALGNSCTCAHCAHMRAATFLLQVLPCARALDCINILQHQSSKQACINIVQHVCSPVSRPAAAHSICAVLWAGLLRLTKTKTAGTNHSEDWVGSYWQCWLKHTQAMCFP